MGFFDSLLGTETETKSLSTLSPEQQELLRDVSGFLQRGLGMGATPSAYAPYAQSDLYTQALRGAGGLAGTGTGTILGALQRQAAGTPAYQPSPAQTISDWRQNYASPLMATFRSEVAPLVRESYNIPGMRHSTLAARGVSDAASRFYGSQVGPTLFSAQEADRARQG
jgi:hypothetical protein